MDFYSLMNSWVNYNYNQTRDGKLDKRARKRQLLNEVSRRWGQEIGDWFEENPDSLSFNDLFKGQLRYVVPLVTQDNKNLVRILSVLKDEDWVMPSLDGFSTRKVQMKMALGGGESTMVEKDVANLLLKQVTTRVIPKGPRAGEEIESVKELSLSKIIQRSKGVRDKLKKWWRQRQQYYTIDDNWKEIEAFYQGETKDYSILLSRHPIDVLRMSDIDDIKSCHSEAGGYFQCAVAEAKGHGPIAYLVETDQLEYYLHQQTGVGDDESTVDYQIKQIEDGIINNDDAMDRMPRLFRKYTGDDLKDVTGAWARSIDVDVDIFIQVVKNHFAGEPLSKGVINLAKKDDSEGTVQDSNDKTMNDLLKKMDGQEIFRDKDRNVKGMGARARVRLRKFVDEANGVEFAAPERQTYGPHPPGFQEAVMKWSWENQADLFERESAPSFFPENDDLVRYGGSYEDTDDEDLLNDFFQNAHDFTEHGQPYVHSVEKRETEASKAEQWYARVEDLNNMANMRLEHIRCYAEVDTFDDDNPSIDITANITFEFDIEEGEKEIPTPYDDTGEYRALKQILSENFDTWVEDFDFYDDEDELTVNYTLGLGEQYEQTTPQTYANFIGYMRDLEEEYDTYRRQILSALSAAGYSSPTPYQKFEKQIVDAALNIDHFNYSGFTFPYDPKDPIVFEDDVVFSTTKRPALKLSAEASKKLMSAEILQAAFEVKPTQPRMGYDSYSFYLSPDKGGMQPFLNLVRNNLARLNREAMGWTERQMVFDFGTIPDRGSTKYMAKIPKLMRMVKSAGYELALSEDGFDYSIKLVLMDDDDTTTLAVTLRLVQYLDKHIDRIDKAVHLAIKAILQEYLQDLNDQNGEES